MRKKNNTKWTRVLLLPVALIIITFVEACYADDGFSAGYDYQWTTTDTVLEVTWQVINIVDMFQTMDIKNHDDVYEQNPIIGNKSDEFVIGYKLCWAIVHPLFVSILPNNIEMFGVEFNPRRLVQSAFIGVHAGVVAHNFSLGLNVDF